MSGIEFEQKFVLDDRRCDEIFSILRIQESHTLMTIYQCYNKDGDRFRCIKYDAGTKYLREDKKSIKKGTSYSICIEDEIIINEEDFDTQWTKNPTRRLKKHRVELPHHLDHKIVVDFFLKEEDSPYAIIAEDEVILTPNTRLLYLQFELPIYLKEFCLKTVDAKDQSMKIFKSTNMVEANASAVRDAMRKLYEQSI